MAAAMPQTPLSGGHHGRQAGRDVILPNIHDDEALVEIVRQLSE